MEVDEFSNFGPLLGSECFCELRGDYEFEGHEFPVLLEQSFGEGLFLVDLFLAVTHFALKETIIVFFIAGTAETFAFVALVFDCFVDLYDEVVHFGNLPRKRGIQLSDPQAFHHVLQAHIVPLLSETPLP
mgnify:FL=1